MYSLRIIHSVSGEESNHYLGPSYVFTNKQSAGFKAKCKIYIDERFAEDEKVWGIVTIPGPDLSGCYIIDTESHYYIVNQNGSTYDNLTHTDLKR